MKKGILSICIAVVGIYFVYWFNLDLYKQFQNYIEHSKNSSELNPITFTIAKTFTITSLCIGLLSLYFGVISFLKKSKIGGVGIILALLLIICSFIPFWKYMLENSSLDTNF